MKNKKISVGSPYYVMTGLVCAFLFALEFGLSLREYGGALGYVVETGVLRAGANALVFCVALLFSLYHLVMYVRCYRPTQGNPPEKKGRAVNFVFLAVALLGLVVSLTQNGSMVDRMEPPYLSGRVLPLMEQLEEETPDLSTQQAVSSGFVCTNRYLAAPSLLILRQDDPESGGWYHILYRKLYFPKLAQAYVQTLLQEAAEQGCTPQPLGEGVYWDNDPIGAGKPAEVLLLCQGDEVVRVTSAGPWDLRAHGEAWSQALFPQG